MKLNKEEIANKENEEEIKGRTVKHGRTEREAQKEV